MANCVSNINPEDVFPPRDLPGRSENWGRAVEGRGVTVEKAVLAQGQSLSATNRSIAASTASLAGQIASLAQAQATLATTVTDLGTTQSELSATQSELSATQAELVTAQADIATNVSDLSATQAELVTAQATLADTVNAIVVPINARVGDGTLYTLPSTLSVLLTASVTVPTGYTTVSLTATSWINANNGSGAQDILATSLVADGIDNNDQFAVVSNGGSGILNQTVLGGLTSITTGTIDVSLWAKYEGGTSWGASNTYALVKVLAIFSK